MEDKALIGEVGQTIWGPEWQGPMAQALSQPKGTIADWTSGRVAVPADIWKDLREIARLHRLKLADLDPRIVENYDAAMARAAAKKAR